MAERKFKNEFAFDFQLIGIATSLKEYKLCYHLNNFLDCNFQKVNDLTFEAADRSRKIQFSVLKAGDENDKNQFFVFANKSSGEVLLPEVSNFDFIIQVNGKCDENEIKNLIAAVKQFPEVIMVSEIPVKKIKNRERLVYVEEKPT